MLSHVDDGFSSLVAKLTTEGRIPCDGYKHSCLRRRVNVRLRATGAESFLRYADLLDQTPDEWAQLRDALTVNVTSFFRDRVVYETLRDRVFSQFARSGRPVHAWSAGCASGEEAWTLAMLLADSCGLEGTHLLATDIDRRCLDRARAATYQSALVQDVPAQLRDAFLVGDEPVTVRADLRARVRIERHDMLAESPPAEELDLISCRNVIIYFVRDAQELLFERFANALRIGGVLVLGKVEMLSGPARARFKAVNARERIYERVA